MSALPVSVFPWRAVARSPWSLEVVECAHYIFAAVVLMVGAPVFLGVVPDMLRDLLLPPFTLPSGAMAVQLLVGVALLTFGAITLKSGRWMARRTRRGLSLAWAGVECLTGVGLLVGLPTLYVLTRKRIAGVYQTALGEVSAFPVDVPEMRQ